MAQPKPTTALTDICSVMHNSTLYTYSSAAFQSLALTQGAQWQTLPSGESVTGGICVGSTPADDSTAGFYVVGGNGKTTGYKGMQKYTYSTGKWESISPVVPVTQDRIGHGAAYMTSSDKIVVYAGNQGGSSATISTQTFAISAAAPYGVLAFQSSAPPSISPLLLPWSSSTVAMIGGGETNTRVMLFSAEAGWVDSNSTLATPLQQGSAPYTASLTTGDDGSKMLYTFDMSKSPNEVNHTVLVDASGHPVKNAAATSLRMRDSHHRSSKHTRSSITPLTLPNWPTYNSTLVSSAKRSQYAAAEDGNGLVVFAGGNTEDVLCVFDGKANNWQNATSLLVQAKSATSPTSITSSSSSAATVVAASSTPTASSTSDASDGNGLGISTSVLGAILGTVAGILVLLMIVYYMMKRRKNKQGSVQAGHVRKSSGLSDEPIKEGMAYTSDKYTRSPSRSTYRGGHQQQGSDASYSSMAILMGKINSKKSMDTERGRKSFSSRHSWSSSGVKGTISNPMPLFGPRLPPMPPLEPMIPEDKSDYFSVHNFGEDAAPTPRSIPPTPKSVPPTPKSIPPSLMPTDTRRSSGWNRYWSGESGMKTLDPRASGPAMPDRSTVLSDSSHYSKTSFTNHASTYTDLQTNNRTTQDSATVPPLNIPSDGQLRYNRVVSGSPTITQQPQQSDQQHAAQQAPRFDMNSSGLMDYSKSGHSSIISGYSSGIPASVHEAWDPTALAEQPWGMPKKGQPRAPSSAYSAGGTGGGGWGQSSVAHQSHLTPHPLSLFPSPNQRGNQKQGQGSRVSSGAPPPPTLGVSQQPQLAMAATSSDMSWLNLGTPQPR